MNCPNCGLQILPGHKFCRSCGNSLELITQPLAGDAAVSDPKSAPAIGLKDGRLRANKLMRLGFIVMFIGVAIGIIGKMMVQDEMVTSVGVLLSVVGMFLTVYPSLLPSPRQRFDSSLSSQPENLTQSQSDKYLSQEKKIGYVPSVIEKTTDLLEDSITTRPKQKGGESQRPNR